MASSQTLLDRLRNPGYTRVTLPAGPKVTAAGVPALTPEGFTQILGILKAQGGRYTPNQVLTGPKITTKTDLSGLFTGSKQQEKQPRLTGDQERLLEQLRGNVNWKPIPGPYRERGPQLIPMPDKIWRTNMTDDQIRLALMFGYTTGNPLTDQLNILGHVVQRRSDRPPYDENLDEPGLGRRPDILTRLFQDNTWEQVNAKQGITPSDIPTWAVTRQIERNFAENPHYNEDLKHYLSTNLNELKDVQRAALSGIMAAMRRRPGAP